jgi:hypothetical protein
MNLLIRYFQLNWLKLFLLITLTNILLVWLSKNLLLNEIVFYNTYSDQLNYERSLKLFQHLKEFAWVSYLLTPIILLIKFSIISFILFIGVVLFNYQSKISLKAIFRLVIASEIIFVFAGFIKFFWFYFVAGNYDLKELSFFYPLSLLNLFKIGEVEKIWVYPFQTINLFQLGYILLVSFGLNKICKVNKNSSERIVIFSYVPALILWVVLIMFLTIDISV